MDEISILLWFCFAFIIVESIILIINGWRCPITIKAEKYSQNNEAGFDIYLPKWVAKYNKSIFTGIFIIEIAFLIFRILT